MRVNICLFVFTGINGLCLSENLSHGSSKDKQKKDAGWLMLKTNLWNHSSSIKRYRISTVSLIIRAATAFLYVKYHEKMRSTLLVINHGLFFLDINCWGHYFKKINLAILWQRTWKKAWRIFRAYFSAETEINLFSSDGVQHVCCENRRMQSLNSEAQCWKCEGVGHMTFINGNISAYRHIKILTD